MSPLTTHKICRDADAPWWELRISSNSGDCYRPHTHEEYSIGIVDDGQALFRHANDAARIGAGTVVMIEPQVVHSCNPLPAGRWSYRMLYIRAEWLHAALAKEWGASSPIASLEFLTHCVDAPAVSNAIDQICTASGGTSNHLAAELSQFLSNWVRVRPERSKAAGTGALAPAEMLLQSEAGYDVSVGTLAETCGMTPTRFIREFHKCYGMTPGDYLQDKRVNGARRLIANGMPICQAALEMGFSDQAHLQRAFKSRHAMTPGSYRS